MLAYQSVGTKEEKETRVRASELVQVDGNGFSGLARLHKWEKINKSRDVGLLIHVEQYQFLFRRHLYVENVHD